MLLYKRNELSDSAEVVYVDGAYVMAVNLFLIFCAAATPIIAFSGAVLWISRNMAVFYAVYIISVVLIISVQAGHSHKYYMMCYYLSTIIILLIPFSGTLVYIFPICLVGGNVSAGLSVIFSVLLIYGGAFLVFSINKMLKSGITCFIISLVYFFIGALILYGFLSVDSDTMSKVEWSTIYSLWT